MSFVTLALLVFLAVPLLLAAVYCLCRRRMRPAALLLLVAALVACFGVHEYQGLQAKSLDDQIAAYQESASENAAKNFDDAVGLLQDIPFERPDRQKVSRAIDALESIAQNTQNDAIRTAYPDAPVLSAYARTLGIIATYNGHMTAQDVRKDQPLLDLVQRIPADYSGTLADKILPARRLLLAMKEDADRAVQRDALDLAAHQEAARRGGVHKGDSEVDLLARLGTPDHLNSTAAEDGSTLRQYVFRRDSRYIYVYAKDGFVTDVRDDGK